MASTIALFCQASATQHNLLNSPALTAQPSRRDGRLS